MAEEDIARKGPDAKLLGRTRATVDNRADGMQAQLTRWLQRMARFQARLEIAELQQSVIAQTIFAKAETTQASLEAELRRILVNNGRSMARSATRRALGDRSADVTDAVMRDFLRDKNIKLQQIMAETRQAVKDSVRQIMLTALQEVPRPTTGEIARRIRTVYHGDVGGAKEGEFPAPLINSRVLPTRRVRTDSGGNLYVFSSERAALIARTEMNQAENTGIVDGYRQSGVEKIMWLSYRDSRSTRGHDEMYRKTVKLGESFILPDRTPMLYPGWYRAPIKHLANCRCTTKPVITV